MINSVEEFIRLRRSEVPEEYYRANHDEAPSEVWMDVYRSRPDLAVYIALNQSAVPGEVLELLARDPEWGVRSTVARRPDLSLKLLSELASDADEAVRTGVIANPRTTKDILEGILSKEWFEPNIELANERLSGFG